MKKGYSRKMASSWYKRVKYDNNHYRDIYSEAELKSIHDRGFLVRSIEKYDLLNNAEGDYITDFEYIFLHPFNNSFSKWLDDIITTSRILFRFPEVNRKIYFTIFQREQEQLIFKVNETARKYTAEDILNFIKEQHIVELRPSFWLSKKIRYKIEYYDDVLKINGEEKCENDFLQIITDLNANYIISEYLDLYYKTINEKKYDNYIKLYVANDCGNEPVILDGYINLLHEEIIDDSNKRIKEEYEIDISTGEFNFDGGSTIENWGSIKESLLHIASELKQVNFFSVSILPDSHCFKILSLSPSPLLPVNGIGADLNNYLKNKFLIRRKNSALTTKDRLKAIKKSLFNKFVYKYCRKGIRPYMQSLWFHAIKDDLLHTHMSIFKKIWAWKRGFFSYRIQQYGLNNNNYTEFLSDYDYYYLNRINNHYQIWINDKTTFRYIFEPFKQYIPEYYYCIFRRNYSTNIIKMFDLPTEYEDGWQGLFHLLREKKKLALKPSAGTHGDGFYCLSFEDEKFYLNGKVMTQEEIISKIEGFKSFYLVTEYISMNTQLKRIYDKSVNSIRMMVINRKGYNPKIAQAYMRIGSESTGYTDNVGYGGICVMIDIESGEMYNPERIIDHKFQPCLKHPDTGVEIKGKIPNWEIVSEAIPEICRYFPELEYLGFDIAITDEGFQIIEVNIHQDLHKVATHSEEIKEYFREKLIDKKNMNTKEGKG